MRRLRALFRELSVAVRDEAQSVIGIALGIALTLLAIAVGIPDDKWRSWGGETAVITVSNLQIALGLSFLALLLFAGIRICWRLNRPSDPIPDVPSVYSCRVMDTDEDARFINKELVPIVFPDGSIDADHAFRAQRKNPRRLIGLIDTRYNELAGWASIWPVTAKAGKAIECGRRTDDDLKVDDVLPAWRNKHAQYLVLVSFAILPQYRNSPENPVRRFGRFALDYIIHEFIGPTSGRTVNLVAVAYSRGGERLCGEFLKLERNGCYADYGPKGRKPIYAGQATAASLMKVAQYL